MIALKIAGLIALYAFMLAAVAAIPFGIPGEVLIALAGLGLALGGAVGWELALIIAGAAVLVEALDFAASFIGVRKAGGSKAAAWGAVGGSMLLALLCAPILPPLGALAGAFVGAFLGAFVVERKKAGSAGAAKIGLGAMLAKAFSVVLKVFAAIAMIAAITFGLW